jgi:outer membrane autotransporter protein
VSGLAAATFPGERWLVSSGVSGTYKAQWLEIEPSASVYAIWEHDAAYTDSLGTQQSDNTFSTGRVSAGVKMGYPLAWDRVTTLAPYVGLYAPTPIFQARLQHSCCQRNSSRDGQLGRLRA